ncbi:PREDICTED: uncharacterized protein LOC109153489 [Ipomoea nil]|uniref:uncharacterized protein LOC109153489 n=1 Tax=Ipomoea nil TaxID=35883 RepID=UPI000902008A|nr:PREDICTED: uncharacterized protein LOC109153489 [Ipomoea nil]
MADKKDIPSQDPSVARKNKTGGRHYHCKKCGKDHPRTNCSGNPIRCFKCGKVGHRAYECYANQKGNASSQGPNEGGRQLKKRSYRNQSGNKNDKGGQRVKHDSIKNKRSRKENQGQNSGHGNQLMKRAQVKVVGVETGTLLMNAIPV